MRKLTLVTAMLLLSTGAFADGSRGLSMPQPAVQQATGQQSQIRRAEVTILPGPAEQPAVTSPPSIEDKLRAAGELRPDGTPARQPQPQPQIRALTPPQVQTQAPVQTPPPVQTQAAVQTAPAPAPVHATAPEAAKRAAHAYKPAKKRVARRDSTERKVRRFAARFGIYW